MSHLTMNSLEGERASLKQESSQVPHLPWDMLIEIASHCRIDELHALTMVNTHMRDLIDRYIPTIAPTVARVTFPNSKLLFRHMHDQEFFGHRELRRLIPHHLAAILVNKHRIANEDGRPCYGIPAEAPGGDYVRKRVARGWHILRKLHLIARDMHASYTEEELAQQDPQSPRFSLDACKMKEDVIQQRRMDYIFGLPEYSEKIRDYIMLTTLLPSVFCMSKTYVGDEYEPWIFDRGDAFDPLRAFRHGESWLSWFVLAEGPDIFWAQWWSLPPDVAQNYIARRAIDTYRALDPALVDYQRMLMRRFHDAVRDLGGFKLHDAGNLKPHLYFPYVPKGKRPPKEYRARETLQHVPFLAKFRCPDGVEEPSHVILSPW